PAKPLGVRVIRVAEDRDVRVVVRNIVRVDPRNVGDHEVGRIDPVRRREPMLGSTASSLPRMKRSTPHNRIVAIPAADPSTVTASYKRGLSLARAGAFFEAHEA